MHSNFQMDTSLLWIDAALIFPTTYNGIRTKNRPVWITPSAAPIRWMGPIRNPRWEQKRTEGYVIVSNYLSQEPSWSWSYGSWVYTECISPPTLWVRIPFRRGVLDTIICDKVCHWLAADPGTPVSFTNKNDRHDITEIFLKVVLNTITLTTC
jgi:hypothetical protein